MTVLTIEKINELISKEDQNWEQKKNTKDNEQHRRGKQYNP